MTLVVSALGGAVGLWVYYLRRWHNHPQPDHTDGDHELDSLVQAFGGSSGLHYHCTTGPWPWSGGSCYWHTHGGGGGGNVS